MPTPISAVIRSLHEQATLNIICTREHEGYEEPMHELPHNFYALCGGPFQPWNEQRRPKPSNRFELRGDLNQQIKNDMVFDVAISHDRLSQYPAISNIARQLNCPLICAEHCLPWPTWSANVTQQYAANRGDINLFVSEFSARQWYYDPNDNDVEILPPSVNTDFFDGWTGGDGKVMTAVWDYIRRDILCGFSLYKQVTNQLPTNPWGDTPGFSKNAESINHLREQYRGASVFLNTTQWSSCPVSLLEAMSVGCPVVTTATTMIPSIVQDGVNGFITNDPGEMRQRLIQVMGDKTLARDLGQAARQTMIDNFDTRSFVSRWDSILRRCVGD